MKVGDLVHWEWCLNEIDSFQAEYKGIIVKSKFIKNAKERIEVFTVFTSDNEILNIRKDDPSLKLIK